MAAFAAHERKHSELVSWIGAMVVFAAIYAWHLSLASTLPQTGDLMSAGWLYWGGWGFALETAKRNYALSKRPITLWPFRCVSRCSALRVILTGGSAASASLLAAISRHFCSWGGRTLPIGGCCFHRCFLSAWRFPHLRCAISLRVHGQDAAYLTRCWPCNPPGAGAQTRCRTSLSIITHSGECYRKACRD